MAPISEPVFSIYVLKSLKDGERYIGLSASVSKRIFQHNSGKVKSTKSRRPLVLVHEEICGTLSDARAREKQLKTSAGRKWLKIHGW